MERFQIPRSRGSSVSASLCRSKDAAIRSLASPREGGIPTRGQRVLFPALLSAPLTGGYDKTSPVQGEVSPPISREAADGGGCSGASALASVLRRRDGHWPSARAQRTERSSVIASLCRGKDAAIRSLASPSGGGGSRRSPARRLTEGAHPFRTTNALSRAFLRSPRVPSVPVA